MLRLILSVKARWSAVDWTVTVYTLLTGFLILLNARNIPEWVLLLSFRAALLFALLLLPPRGSPWEVPRVGEGRLTRMLRRSSCFLRYAYPLPIVLFFFQEVRFTVNGLAPATPYWFEPHLYDWDRTLFGELPAIALSSWVNKPLSELMHALYFTYYLILIGGLLVAWYGQGKNKLAARAKGISGNVPPGPGFSPMITGMTFAFLLSFVHFPFLPARGPWENPELMSPLPPLEGFLFKPLVDFIIDRGAVPGGCFPSSHVAGSWGTVIGLTNMHRPAAVWLGIATLGMGGACVYTRYHHGVDIVAGMLIGLLGGWVGRMISEKLDCS